MVAGIRGWLKAVGGCSIMQFGRQMFGARTPFASSPSMFLNLTLASGHTIPIITSDILSPALALPCSMALHVKCRLLPEDLITLPNIGAWHGGRDSAPVRG